MSHARNDTVRRQPTIVTKRLVLRPFRNADVSRLAELANDRRIAQKTLLIPHPYTEQTAREWIATHRGKFERGEDVVFAVTTGNDEEPIGAVGLSIFHEHNRGEIGYWMGVPYWNQGYCTEAARAMLAYGFEELNLHKICANHFATNPASGRVMANIGMTREGVFKSHIEKWGEYEDMVCYGILKSEYVSGVSRQGSEGCSPSRTDMGE
ncbi:MAG: GNAT family N-acetyltransferase [Deltaproteobacteria bacterium]|nr:GNAT family N-acetyltransferase [Candidatus Zymogenaceae bacterium]